MQTLNSRQFRHYNLVTFSREGTMPIYATAEVHMMGHGQQEITSDPDGGIWQPKAPLSVEGRRIIRVVAEARADIPYARFESSPLERAMETRAMMAAPHGQRGNTAMRPPMAELGSARMHAWDTAFPSNTTPTITEMYKLQPGLLRGEGRWVLEGILCIYGRLRIGEKALAISHSPLIECAAAEAENVWPPRFSLGKGDILIFRFHGIRRVEFEHQPCTIK